MSTGMWFVVCIPKKEYEVTLKSGKEKEKSESKESLTNIDEEDKIPTEKGDVKTEKGIKEKRSSTEHDDMVYFVDKDGPMEETLEDALQILGIKDAVWVAGRNEKFHQVCFPCETGFRCDEILRVLLGRGIGTHGRSTIGVMPCSVFYREFQEEYGLDDYEKVKAEKSKELTGFKSMQEQFLKSVTSRLTVAQVVESVRAQALLTFDYIVFIALAGMIAALGLLENSSVVIVASMLVSQLMGPIMAITFGAVIRDNSLINIGMKSELIGIALCIIIGLIFGLVCGNFDHRWGPNPFPTSEMFGRGMPRSLWVGVLIALPSGAGVALSVLGGNAGSLVGVAISASLLPPAVNAGLLWGVALVKHFQAMAGSHNREMQILDDGTIVEERTPLSPPKGYEYSYFPEMDSECAVLGVVSLLLTVVNIICIFISACVVLKIKEVAPHTSVPSTARFWKHDLKIARGYNKTVGRGGEGKQMGQTLLKEWAELNGLDPDEVLSKTDRAKITRMQTLDDLLQDVQADDVYRTVTRNVPGGNSHRLYKRMASWPQHEEELYGDVDADVYRRRAYTHTQPLKAFLRRKGKQHREQHEGISVSMDNAEEGVELRHPTPRSPEAQHAAGLLRRSLSTAASPYSLWPMHHHPTRFVVTKVPEALPPLPPRYSRRGYSPQMESNI